tara:strand:+ start:588 stop:1691 length:1104 start_codon:yes stop_codon:yes gene_type:complete
MQLVKIQRDAILKPLQIVSGIVERRHTLPILANILIKKEGNSIFFLSTDIEIQISTHADIGFGEESSVITVAAKKMLDILRALPETEISLTLKNKRISIQYGKSRFALQTLPSDEFPTFIESDKFDASIELPQKNLKQLFDMVYFSMAHQDIRYYLNGMLLVIDGNKVIAVATDGHRLAFSQIEIKENHDHHEVIIPRKTITELQRLLNYKDESVLLKISSNQIKVNFDNIELLSKLVEGKFPDYNRVIPKPYKNKFSIKREFLLKSLQRIAIMTSDKFKGIRCMVSNGSLKISSQNAEQEEAIEEIEIDYSGEIVDIGFNVTYLLDVLNNLKIDVINISLGDTNSSALITLNDDTNFKYVVMPMRI